MKKTRNVTTTIILLVFFAIYFIALFKITIFQGAPSEERSLNLIPFVTISEYIGFILNGNRIIGITNIFGNIILFLPLGYMSAVLFPQMRKLTKILTSVLFFSLTIEVCQYIFACGSADIDDMILNVLGGIIGYLIYICFKPQKYAILISGLMIVVTCTGFYARNNLMFTLPRPDHLEPLQRIETNNEPTKINEKDTSAFSDISINSTNAFLIQLDKNKDKTLFDKGGNERIYPASMTKIMTAIVALENIDNLDIKITLNDSMFSSIYSSNSSVAGFLPGEKVQAIDLLYGLMLPSGAECAVGLAEYVAGSESAFVDLMNEKARKLGMNDTHFVNTTGLHNNNHYSTAKDIATLVEYAIKNDTFYKVFTTARYSAKPTNRHAEGITFYSTMFSNMKRANFDGGVILGGKTGYTGEAGQCLASLAEKNEKRYILVTCGAPGDNKTQQLHIDDTIKIFNKID